MRDSESYSNKIRAVIPIIEEKNDKREFLIKRSRDIMALIRKTINYIHIDRLDQAETLLKDIKESISQLIEKIRDFPPLLYSATMNNMLQEYVEALSYYKIIREGDIPSYEECLLTDVTQYVMGLADVIGELRRRVLECIRKGEIKDAESLFNIMESLYLSLIEVAHYDVVIPGIRRKCDVARVLVENTRSELIEAKISMDVIEHIRKMLSKSR